MNEPDGTAGGSAEHRWIRSTGLQNLRDLGGYRSISGGQTSWGVLYRSGTLAEIPADRTNAFAELAIESILDLRKLEEREQDPGPFPSLHLELPSRHLLSTDPETLQTHEDGERWPHEDYLHMLHHGTTAIGQLVAHIARANGPTLIHCLSGKDRTGILAALVLTALGVPRQTVLDDYQLTSRYQGPDQLPHVIDHFVSLGIGTDAAKAVLSTPRWTMAKALDTLDTDLGGIDIYLTEQCQVPVDDLQRLRSRLMT